MKILKKNRVFKPGPNISSITDCGRIKLLNNEQVTFISFGKEYDFCKTNWGFYASPSINSRLKSQKFRCFLIKNKNKKKYFVVVNNSKIQVFKKFLKKTQHSIIQEL